MFLFVLIVAGRLFFWDSAVDKQKGEIIENFPCPNCGAKHTKKQVSKAMQTVFDKAMNKTIQQAKTVPVLIQYVDEKGKRHEKKPDDFELIKKIENADISYWFPKDEMCEKGERWGDTWRAGVHAGITSVHQFYTKRNLWVLASIRNRLNDKKKIMNVFDSIDTFLTSKLVRYNQGKRGK